MAEFLQDLEAQKKKQAEENMVAGTNSIISLRNGDWAMYDMNVTFLFSKQLNQ